MNKIIVTEYEQGQRIDNFLRKKFKKIPKSIVYRMIRKGEVRVNASRIQAMYKLVTGDKIRIPPYLLITYKENSIKNFSSNLTKFRILNDYILYEDNHLIILNKPSGMAVHGGSGLSFGVIEALRILRPNIHSMNLVHRLDRETSGILLIAKNQKILRSLNEQLRERNIKKDYLALVMGKWLNNKFINVPLLKKTEKNGIRIVQVNKKNGKHAETYFKIKEQFNFATLMKIHPITGRTHQIRVHAMYVGHPIALDNVYGDNKFNNLLLSKIGLNRLFLHALSLKFIHPHTKKYLFIEAPIDKKLYDCLNQLRKIKLN